MTQQRRTNKRAAVVVMLPRRSAASQYLNTALGAVIGVLGSIVVAFLTRSQEQPAEAHGDVRVFVQPNPLPTPSPCPTESPQAKTPPRGSESSRQLPWMRPCPEKRDVGTSPKSPARDEEWGPEPLRTGVGRERATVRGDTERGRALLPPPAPATLAAQAQAEQPRPFFSTARQAPPPAALPPEVEVEALARLDNFRVPDSRPLLALAEDVELTIAGRRVRLSVAGKGPREVSESLVLPEGEHDYTLRCSARARCFPEGGGWPFALSLTGSGEGKVLVKKGTRLVLKREVCQGQRYAARLEQCK